MNLYWEQKYKQVSGALQVSEMTVCTVCTQFTVIPKKEATLVFGKQRRSEMPPVNFAQNFIVPIYTNSG